jgi:hypothetical protein
MATIASTTRKKIETILKPVNSKGTTLMNSAYAESAMIIVRIKKNNFLPLRNITEAPTTDKMTNGRPIAELIFLPISNNLLRNVSALKTPVNREVCDFARRFEKKCEDEESAPQSIISTCIERIGR